MISGLYERAKYYSSLLTPDLASGYLRMPRREPPSNAEALAGAIDWICRAQDATGDGGVARSYSLVYNPFFKRRGWIPSYPETTGYIIPTVFDCARRMDRTDLAERAVRMASWESDVQMPNGAVKGGTIDQPPTPAVFNTGQVLFGWVRAFEETGDDRFLTSARRAGDFLKSVQDADGAWRKSLSDYASGTMTSYTYNTRSAWGLVEVARVSGDASYRDAAVRNVEFALREQQPNGWFRNNCLHDPVQPLLHTIAYSLRGVLEIGDATRQSRFIDAARKAADALLARQREDGSLAGRFDAEWRPTVEWSCLTGNSQMGLVWGRLFQITGDSKYRRGLERANHYMRSVQWQGTGNPGLDGGISGSFPLHGTYGRFEVLNWAVKFFADALMLEDSIASSRSSTATAGATAGAVPARP
jgi:squalene-hopene cyclase-like protein/prenyltransferase/squalene oxidase-like repeat protein